MTELEWARADPQVTAEIVLEDGLCECVTYLFGLADEQGIDTSDWLTSRMEAAVLRIVEESD